MVFPTMRRLLQSENNPLLNDSIEGSGLDSSVDEYNTTGIVIRALDDEGLVEPEASVGYTDMQTVIIACAVTMLLLVVILVAAICIRLVWTKLLRGQDEGYRGVLQRDESSDPLGGKSRSTSGHLLSDELKISESQFSMNPGDDIDDIAQSPIINYSNLSSSVQNHTSKSSNGSIITMTLKNNHLIVETEERCSVIPENSKTTTKFTASSSPHHNNVFVVEVQHANMEAGASGYPNYPKVTSEADIYEVDEENEGASGLRSQKVQVHQPPDGSLEDVQEDDEGCLGSSNTGLSQSDLSLSSAGSNNPSYRYGNQLGYGSGHYGYPEYIGYDADSEVVGQGRGMTGQDEEDKHLKEQMKLGNWVMENGNVKGGYNPDDLKLKSTLYRQASLPQRLKEEESAIGKKGTGDEKGVDEINEKEDTLGAIKSFKPVLESVEEKNLGDKEQSLPFSSKKRASLPIITPELYTQIKQTKNIILDKTSPTFKKFQNDVSPLEDAEKEAVEVEDSKFGEHENKTFTSGDE